MILLFDKEKEYLAPLPNKDLLNSWEVEMKSCKFTSSFLIEINRAKYSVPPYLINKAIKYKEVDKRPLIECVTLKGFI